MPCPTKAISTLQLQAGSRHSISIAGGRSFAIKAAMDEEKFDALEHYDTNPFFTDAERAALDYVTELTRNKNVNRATFDRMLRYYSEREICEIVWVVASEHLYNITNLGLNIHSDLLCNIKRKK